MANRTILLCLVLSLTVAWYIDSAFGSPRRGGWSSRPSSSHSSSSWSKPSYSKPSSSGTSWSSWSKPSYPSSGGLSGYGSGSSKPSYPSSSSGLSGSSSGSSGSSWWNSKPSYPSSSSGLSGSGSSKPSYPSSSSGLSGSNSGSSWWNSKPSYPSSGSGLSGSGSSKPSYPTSGSGLSGSGSSSGSSWWSNSGSGSHTYPKPSGGLSGSGSGSSYIAPLPAGVEYTNNKYGHHNSPSYTNNKYGNNYATPHGSHGTHVVNHHVTNVYHPPTYFTSPQYVYVNEYRSSGSRYGDILTGLALYNMGRSHSYHHDHYYHDDYYRRRYNSDGSMNGNYSPQNSAICTLKITENGRVETLHIPCEIVSTFTNEGKQVTRPESQVNTTMCVTNSTIVNTTVPALAALPVNSTALPVNVTGLPVNVTGLPANVTALPANATSINSTLSSNVTNVNGTSVNSTMISNVTMTNSTTCTFTVNAIDPLRAKGPPLNPSNMECEVEIITRGMRTSNKVSCDTLVSYAKMPEPTKKETILLPERQKLKNLLNKPPWWMSLFIAV